MYQPLATNRVHCKVLSQKTYKYEREEVDIPIIDARKPVDDVPQPLPEFSPGGPTRQNRKQ